MIKQYMKMGFGISLGSMGVFIIAMLLGLMFLIPGYIMVKKEIDKPKDKRNTTKMTLGFILMAIGMVISLGLGGGQFFDLLGDAI